MMVNKKRLGLIAGLLVTVFGLLAFLLYRVFPRMKEQCQEMCRKMEQAGVEPPAMCKKMMDKCCPPQKK